MTGIIKNPLPAEAYPGGRWTVKWTPHLFVGATSPLVRPGLFGVIHRAERYTVIDRITVTATGWSSVNEIPGALYTFFPSVWVMSLDRLQEIIEDDTPGFNFFFNSNTRADTYDKFLIGDGDGLGIFRPYRYSAVAGETFTFTKDDFQGPNWMNPGEVLVTQFGSPDRPSSLTTMQVTLRDFIA